jgi:hypothetical protein
MLKNFIAALERHKSELGYNQFWRYSKAQRFPRILTWIVERPELAQALAADAVELAQSRGRPDDTTAPRMAS